MALFANKRSGKVTGSDGFDWTNTSVHREVNAGLGKRYAIKLTEDPDVVQVVTKTDEGDR